MTTSTDEGDALLQKLRNLIERSGQKTDTLGSEMADDARVWRVYSKAAQKHDKELLAQWNGTLDTLLIFAGLFSAVSTTFIIDSYKQMQPDYAKETFKLLLANVSGTHYVQPPVRVEESARAFNCLWISSLIASLSTALIAILAKQWLASYPVSDRENLREWAQLRQYRFDALELWHVPVLIAVVPVLLHLSLMLFLAGLVVFLWDIDRGTMILALVLSAATYGLYGFTTLSPALWSSSPFRTPLTPLLQWVARRCVTSPIGNILTAITSPSGDTPYAHVIGVMSGCCRNVMSDVVNCWIYLLGNVLSWLRYSVGPGQGPSLPAVDPWMTQTVFSAGEAAGALSWLGLHSETTDIYYAVLDGLGDDVRGATVADDLAPALRTRISLQTPDLISGRTSNDLQAVVTHLRAAYTLRSLISSRDMRTWTSRAVWSVRSGESEIHTRRYYDTILRVFAAQEKEERRDGFHDLWRFFGYRKVQEAQETSSLILPSTAHSVAQLFIDAKEPGGSTVFRTNVLTMLNALRLHLVECPHLVASLLRCSFVEEEDSVEEKGRLITKPPHDCDETSCEAMNYLVVILAQHDFGASPWESYMSTEVAVSLKERTFETFALFCRGFTPSESCTHLRSNLTSWLSGEEPLAQILLCGRDIAALLPYFPASLSLDSHLCLIRHMLHLDHSWCAPDSSDPFRGDGLTACLDSIVDIGHCGALNLPELTILLDDACLEPLQRAPHWNNRPLLRMCATTLANASYDGASIGGLVSKFIFCEAKGGSDGATRTWDLLVAGAQQILELAKESEPWFLLRLEDLCGSLGRLRQRYPHKARWKEMGDRVRHGATFLTNSAWKARTSAPNRDRVRKALKNFCRVMDIEDGHVGSIPLGLEVNNASQLADGDLR